MGRLAGSPARRHYKMVADYFPDITQAQAEQFRLLPSLYSEWNKKINVISRKDIDHFEIRHLLHSLSISLIFNFTKGTRIMDAGTGGGLPGIPLAIFFPDAEFLLVDSTGKKIQVVQAIAGELGLRNVTAVKARYEDINDKFDFVTGRAVTALPAIFSSLKNKISAHGRNDRPNGIIYLKGGDFGDELKLIKSKINIYNLSDYFSDPYFETKKLVHFYDFI